MTGKEHKTTSSNQGWWPLQQRSRLR